MSTNLNVQILYFNIALFIFNLIFLQIIIKKIFDYLIYKKQLDKKPEQVLLEASSKAQQIISDAVDEASKLIAKSGEKVNTIVILVPITYQQHIFALHFISKS